MLFPRLIITALVLSLGLIAPGYAQAPAPGQLRLPNITHVPLSQDKVQRLLQSMPEMQAFGKKHQLNKLPKGTMKDPNAALMKYLQENNLLNEMQALLNKYGFKSVQEWTRIMQSVTVAYGFAKSGKTPAQMKAEMQAMIDKLQADPNMSPQQKSGLITMFRQQMGMALKMAPPAGNIEVVKQMLPQIEQAMKRK